MEWECMAKAVCSNLCPIICVSGHRDIQANDRANTGVKQFSNRSYPMRADAIVGILNK